MKRRLLLLALFLSAGYSRQSGTQSEVSAPDAVQEAASRIDTALMADRETARTTYGEVPPLPERADDVIFLRRVCIDLAGRLPRAEEVRAFLADSSSQKRACLIDALVIEPGATEVRFRMLAEALRVKDEVAGESQAPFIAWLREAAAEDLPFDKLVSAMLHADGTVKDNPAAGMLRRDGKDVLHTSAELTRTLLGTEIYCALCHDHPYNDFSQRECWEFAAFFKPAKDGPLVLPIKYEYQVGQPAEVLTPRFLRSEGLRVTASPSQLTKPAEQRAWLANWFTNADNHRFVTVAALRAWSGLFGMPDVGATQALDGVPGLTPEHEFNGMLPTQGYDRSCFAQFNPSGISWIDLPLHDPTMRSQYGSNVLREEFVRCGFRIGEFQRILARTEAYSRAGHDRSLNWNGTFLVATPLIRRLPSEVIWDTIVTRLPQIQSDWLVSSQSLQVPPASHPLRLLGRGAREWTDESATPISHALVHFMMNSPLVEQCVGSSHSDTDIDELFLSILGRLPRPSEKLKAEQHRQDSPQTAAQDITWALLNTKEFMFRQ